ncbi:MAG TPA: RNA 2',3'-cyclic phosphodiesterase [Sulfurivirga caldicuralii]|nr:RNA 2',3'-cyclic phosphodiesterase [Sulfurivirga caldicuralii]
MRLFVAVPVTEPLQKQLKDQLAALRPQLPDHLCWIPPQNWHLTVYFLGDGFRPEQATALAQIIEQGFAHLSAFAAPLVRIGGFPAHKPVVLAGLFERNLMLQALHDEVYQALKGCEGVKKPQNRFMPHISLARIDRQKNSWQKIREAPIEDLWLPVDEVVLYRSCFTAEGVRYQSLARGRLA